MFSQSENRQARARFPVEIWSNCFIFHRAIDNISCKPCSSVSGEPKPLRAIACRDPNTTERTVWFQYLSSRYTGRTLSLSTHRASLFYLFWSTRKRFRTHCRHVSILLILLVLLPPFGSPIPSIVARRPSINA